MKKVLSGIFYIIFILAFTILLFNIVFINEKAFFKPNILFLFINIIICFLLFYLFYIVWKKFIKHKKIFFIIAFILFIILQFLFLYAFEVYPSWDYKDVFDGVKADVLLNKSIFKNIYFYTYTNNIGLGILYKFFFLIFKLFRFKDLMYLHGITVVNIVFIDIALLYLYKIFRLYNTNENSMFLLICSFFITPFITYGPIAYTDTFSLPFAVISIYFFLKYVTGNKQDNKLFIISGLFLGFGLCLKFSLIVILVAYIIYILFTNEKIKEKLVIMALLICFTFIPYLNLSIIEKVCMDEKVLNEEKLPYTHWLMMGVNDDGITVGGYSELDFRNTSEYKTKKLKKEYNKKVISQRLQDKVLNKKLLNFYTRKVAYQWGDGSFYSTIILERYPVRKINVRKYIIGITYDMKTYYLLCQTQLIIIISMIILSVLLKRYLTEKEKNILFLNSIIIFGVFLFFILWETRSRYLINFIPVLLIEVYLGVVACKRLIFEKVRRKV